MVIKSKNKSFDLCLSFLIHSKINITVVYLWLLGPLPFSLMRTISLGAIRYLEGSFVLQEKGQEHHKVFKL